MPIILFVDRNPVTLSDKKFESLLLQTHTLIKAEIERKKIGPVNIFYDFLSEEVTKEIEKSMYGILITHLPQPYEDSLKKIKWVIENYSFTKIIVFTGASVDADIILRAGAKYVLRKDDDPNANKQKVVNAVENVVYGDSPSSFFARGLFDHFSKG